MNVHGGTYVRGQVFDLTADDSGTLDTPVVWEAAAGERLWKGHSDATIMNRVLNGEIPSPRDTGRNVPLQKTRAKEAC